MPTFQQLLERPSVIPVLLLEISAAVPLRAWIPYNDIWRHALPDGVTVETLEADEAAVTAGASLAAVEATAGRWIQEDGWLYLNPATGEPFDFDVVGFAGFYFSDLSKTFEGNFYDPRLKSVPKLSLRIERRFGGVAQIGGGRFTLENTDGFFDALQNVVRFDSGTAVLKMGLDTPAAAMAYGDYETMSTWRLDGGNATDSVFDLSVRERKLNLRTKIPATKFNRADFPYISRDTEGQPIPTIYGRCYGVPAFLVNPITLNFKVCNHAVAGFIGLRKKETRTVIEQRTPEWFKVSGQSYYRTFFTEEVKGVTLDGDRLDAADELALLATPGRWLLQDNFLYVSRELLGDAPTAANTTVDVEVEYTVWTEIPFATRDAANGEFTVSAADATGSTVLSVDVIGKAVAGEPLENVADIVEDILAAVGETDIDAASFAATRNYFDLGTDRHGNPMTHMKPSLYLDEQEEALEVLERICEITGTFLYTNAAGQWTFLAAQPEPGDGLVSFNETELVEIRREVETDEIYTAAEITFAHRHIEEWSERVKVERDDLRRFAGLPAHNTREVEAELWDTSDARYLAQRILSTEGRPLVLYRAKLPRLAAFILPGDKVSVTRSRGNISEVLEVIEIEFDLDAKSVLLTLGDMRGWRYSSGFWTGDATAAWDANATADEKVAAARNAGFWTDDNGFAVSTDERAQDTSRWW